jgi:hypothetical protein
VPGGFRFYLVHKDGEPADPAMFVTAIPTWKVGDEFLGGSNLQRFRTLAIEPEMTGDAEHHGVFTVEPVE